MYFPRLWQRISHIQKCHPMLILCVATAIPFVCSLVTYTYVSLPDNSISLDQTGSLILLLVLFKVLIVGATGKLPINLNEFFAKRRSKRAPRYLSEEAMVDDLPCTVRILCELETAARTAMEDALPDMEGLHEGQVDERGQTLGDGDRLEGTLLEIDHVEEFHKLAVNALYSNGTTHDPSHVTQDDPDESTTDDANRVSALAALAGITGGGRCEVAYARCYGRLTTRDAFKILFREFDIKGGLHQHLWQLGSGDEHY